MLPIPSTSRQPGKPRIYFPSLPSNSHHPQPPLQRLITHLRTRTRLTNLALTLILAILSVSLLLNITLYLPVHPPDPQRDIKGWEDGSSLEQLDSGIPLSIETTIERDARYGELVHLIMVPGHSIWVGNDVDKVGEDGEWVLEGMQRGGAVKTFKRHIEVGVEQLASDPHALLIFSGGATRAPPAPPLTEGLSYHNLAHALALLPSTPIPHSHTPSHDSKTPLPLNARATLEEFALDSYENLLFSLARFREFTGRYPRRITVVGYGVKRRRYEELHRTAIGWPGGERFNYIGIDDDKDLTEFHAGELKYAYNPFLHSPSGCHPPLSTKRLLRNPYFRYHPYHTSNPELKHLLEWCPPYIDEPGEVSGVGQGVFDGWVPWREGEEGVLWDRERD